MKRICQIISLLLAMLLLASLASCGAKDMEDAGGPPPKGENAGGVYDNFSDTIFGGVDAETPGFSENPFIATAEQRLSTFSADVDTASYSYFRKLINNGYTLTQLKQIASSFRTEEFLNYFRYDASAPTEGSLFGVTADVVPTPWSTATVLMRLSLQAEERINTEGNNLVFLIDVSGSMNSKDKLPLLQESFSLLTESLTERDTVSIVTYSGKEQVVLDGCRGNETQTILDAIAGLRAYGSTNGEAGLNQAYTLAERHRIEGGNNRIIMASDGDLNVGISSEEELTAFVEEKRESGIYLSVLGFGTGNYRDAKMEALADNGNGIYYYIDGASEAERVFGSDLLSTLYTVAENVKLQIDFDPNYVASYRLIGYENRLLAEEDFEDDTKDAGEVGAGHTVTVFYELTLAEGARAADEPWMKLAVRYREPGESTSLYNEYPIGATNLKESPDADVAFMECVIQTVMILHDSRYQNGATLEGVIETLEGLDLADSPDRLEFLNLLKKLV